MAKKKVVKKAAKKTVKKAVKAAKKSVQKAKSAVKKTVEATPLAAAASAAAPEMVDVSEQDKKDSLEMPPAPVDAKPADAPATTPAEKHEEFTQALTQEPPKKGFWSRLFGK